MSTKFKVYDRETGEPLKGHENDYVVMTQNGSFMRITSDGWYTYANGLDMSKYKVKFKKNIIRLAEKHKDWIEYE